MRVLLITYYFPPAGGGGVQRVLSLCRHLSNHGFDVTVAAPEEPKWVDVDTTLVVPSSVTILRTPDPSPEAIIPREELARARNNFHKLVLKAKLQPRRFALPDIHRAWYKPALRTIERYADQNEVSWDIVISSSPPETSHLVASSVAERFSIPWIADFRDSWLDLPHLRLDSPLVRWKHKRQIRLANRVMRRASAITTVSNPLADDLRKRHTNLPVHMISNGVDLAKVRRAQSRASGFMEQDHFVITYTGNFFGRQSPQSFLKGLERSIEREPALKHDLNVKFIGGLKPEDKRTIAESQQLAPVTEVIGFVRHDDVLAYQAAADLLFLYVAPGRGSSGVLTGKVFEYIASMRPILALLPEDNVGVSLLERAGSLSGGQAVAPDDISAISDAIISAWNLWKASSSDSSERRVPDIDVPADVIDEIDREQLANKFAALLSDL